MKKLILTLCAKALYGLGTKVNCDFDADNNNDLLELADKLTLYIAAKGPKDTEPKSEIEKDEAALAE